MGRGVLVVLLFAAACTGRAPENQPPVAKLRTPAIADARQPLTLDARASTDPDGAVVSFTYGFGDGSPSVTRQENETQHVFVGPGRFTMELTVKDDHDAETTITREITLVDHYTPPYCATSEECMNTEVCEADGVCWQN